MTRTQEIQRQVILTLAHRDHHKGLRSHAFFKIHNQMISEDLVQDTFMKTWKYLIRGGKIDVMRAFLYHTLNCLIIDEYRKHKTTSLDLLLENGFEPSAPITDNLATLFDEKTVLILIQHLPEKYQEVMRMRYTQDLSLGEMSVMTGQTKNTTAVQLHRGLEKLKVLYGNQYVTS